MKVKQRVKFSSSLGNCHTWQFTVKNCRHCLTLSILFVLNNFTKRRRCEPSALWSVAATAFWRRTGSCAAKRPSSPWTRPITAHSVQIKSGRVREIEMRRMTHERRPIHYRRQLVAVIGPNSAHLYVTSFTPQFCRRRQRTWPTTTTTTTTTPETTVRRNTSTSRARRMTSS